MGCRGQHGLFRLMLRSLLLCQFSFTLAVASSNLNSQQQTSQHEPRPPVILKETATNFNKMETENVKFRCSVDGHPKPDITWWRNNEQLQDTEDREVKRVTMIIKDLVQEDSGNYSCYAVNDYGELRVNFYLEVIPDDLTSWLDTSSDEFSYSDESETQMPGQERQPMAPEFNYDTKYRFQEDIVTFEGEKITLKCPYKGYPHPSVIWLKDNNLNWTQERNVSDRVKINDFRLTIERLMPSVDRARYTCIVRNEYGSIQYTALLIIVARIPPQPIISEIPDQEVTVGTNVTFECKVVNNATPHILWLKSELTGNYSLVSTNERIDVLTGLKVQAQTLKIYDVTLGDAGLYTCLASNSHSMNWKSAMLTVISTPQPTESPETLLANWIRKQPDISVMDLLVKILEYKCDRT